MQARDSNPSCISDGQEQNGDLFLWMSYELNVDFTDYPLSNVCLCCVSGKKVKESDRTLNYALDHPV